jgi:hypothetical protein
MNVVYFIRSGDAGAIKVGTTATLESRIRDLDCGPEPLSLIGTVPGGRALEKSIHTALRPYRRRLEWFRPTPEVLDFVGRALADPEAIPSMVAELIARRACYIEEVARAGLAAADAANWAVDRICRREGMAAAADVACVTDDQLTKYRQGKARMSALTLLRLKAEWPDDFALWEIILGAGHLHPEEVRANRATLESARDAIDAQLAKLGPAGKRA